MTETKFTPGPWKAMLAGKELDSAFILDSNERAIASLYHEKNNLKTMYSNARLIVAAPEMYEMLASIRTTLKYMGYLPYLVKDIDLILSKARGESEVSDD